MTDESKSTVVTVFGSSMAPAGDELYRSAERLGRMLAERGARVACGGYGGVMEAVSRGARAAGGHALGFTVPDFPGREPNEFLSEERPCGDLYERLQGLIHGSDAWIALGGGIGTLVEVFLAWNEIYMSLIPARPLLLVGSKWPAALESLGGLTELGERHMKLIDLCDDIDSAVELLASRGVFANTAGSGETP